MIQSGLSIGERRVVEHYMVVLRRTLSHAWCSEVPGATERMLDEAMLYLEILLREVRDLRVRRGRTLRNDTLTRSATPKHARSR